ncbi:1-phosphofructokinase family hexose kinase [Curtobacterium sp. RIT-PI-V]|uniref:1-phosphofructokinase family hexose kinase n=1 Tax=Curtobacterium sp. RIT-PI-V TaxID=3035296 RepID=UPI0021D7AFD3|nr:PfkB family carbohydrate kinase [Curtobacterium sp. RIT-PI-V]
MSTVRPDAAAWTGTRTGRTIVTLTPAPAIDRTYSVDTLRGGTVHRAHTVTETLGGNGVNVTRALLAHGAASHAVAPLSPEALAPLDDDAHSGLTPVDLGVRTRVNTVVTAADGVTTNVNEAPAPLTRAQWTTLTVAVLRTTLDTDARWLVVTGCIPAVAGGDHLVDVLPLVVAARAVGLSVAFDVPGHQLTAVLDPLAPVDLVKPNVDELAQAVGHPVTTVDETVRAARALLSRGARRALVTMGAAGALLVDAHRHELVPGVATDCVDTTGAGDAALAGYLAAESDGATPSAAARLAVRWGAAAVAQRGAALRATPATRGDGAQPFRPPHHTDHSTWLRVDSLAATG